MSAYAGVRAYVYLIDSITISVQALDGEPVHLGMSKHSVPSNNTSSTPSNEVTCSSLWHEVLSANLAGRLYPNPPADDAARAERLDVLAVEGLIDARHDGWIVVLDQ